ncbi:hypothetical protein B7463_g1474, partial [Scytalidium lignicola]
MARTSLRSSVERVQASSPAKSTRASQSPNIRRTRRTRSESVELGDDSGAAMNAKRSTRRSAREASVESVESNASADGKAGRRRKGARATAASRVVVEAREATELEEEDDEEEDDNESLGRRRTSKSPDTMSQMSGTTANTSHSVQEMADMNATRIIEYLPDLYRSAYELLKLLIPRRASKDEVLKIVRELQIPGSRTGDLLRLKDQIFNHPREAYGSEQYIRTAYILRKLLKEADPGEESFRPDAILQAANLARMVKDLLVTPRDTQNALFLMQALDMAFPAAFMTGFDTSPNYGKSTMIDDTFEVGLQIRTQTVILSLMSYRGDPAITPEELLVDVFYHPPDRRDEQLSIFDDAIRNSQPKEIARMREGLIAPALLETQNDRIIQRMILIRSAFVKLDVDFDRLDEIFPWTIFLTETVEWSRKRLGEIEKSVETQGGVDSIQRFLANAVKTIDPEINLPYDQPVPVVEPRQLLPAANIIPASTSNSKSFFNPASLRMIEALKASNADAPPSNQNQRIYQRNATRVSNPRTPVPTSSTPTQRASEPIRGNKTDVYAPARQLNTRPAAEYDAAWKKSINEKNKENRPLIEQRQTKPRWIDEQPNRIRIRFEDDESQSVERVQSSRKRTRQEREDTEVDDDFQTDTRPPNPARMKRTRIASQRATSRSTQQTPKRQKTDQRNYDDDDDVFAEESPLRQTRPSVDEALQASIREQEDDDEYRPNNIDHDHDMAQDIPFSQVTVLAKLETLKSKNSHPQKRTPWSDNDADRLIYLIETYGCSWADLEKMGGFELERGQVALKDKARNMKVSYLKSGKRLPRNFDKVKLGRKEKNAVRAVDPDWESD